MATVDLGSNPWFHPILAGIAISLVPDNKEGYNNISLIRYLKLEYFVPSWPTVIVGPQAVNI